MISKSFPLIFLSGITANNALNYYRINKERQQIKLFNCIVDTYKTDSAYI